MPHISMIHYRTNYRWILFTCRVKKHACMVDYDNKFGIYIRDLGSYNACLPFVDTFNVVPINCCTNQTHRSFIFICSHTKQYYSL